MSLTYLPDDKLAQILLHVADSPKTFKSLAFTCKRLLNVAKKVTKDLPYPLRNRYTIYIDSKKMTSRSGGYGCPMHEYDDTEEYCFHHELVSILRSNYSIAASIDFFFDLYLTRCFKAISFMRSSILDKLTGLSLTFVHINADIFVTLITELKSLKYLEIDVKFVLGSGYCHGPRNQCPPEIRRTLELITIGENAEILLVDPRLDLPAKRVKIDFLVEELPFAYLKKYKDFIEHITLDSNVWDEKHLSDLMKENGLDKIKFGLAYDQGQDDDSDYEDDFGWDG